MTHSPFFLAAVTILSGATATGTAIAVGDIVGEQPSIPLIIGFVIVSMIGSIVLMYAKKWLEGLFSKVVDSPTRGEIKTWIEESDSRASGHFKAIKQIVEETRDQVASFHEQYTSGHQTLRDRVTSIEARHSAIDSFKRRSTDN